MASKKVERIIVTGTGGSLGGAVAEHWRSRGAEVIGLDISYPHDVLTEDPDASGLYTLGVNLTEAKQVRAALDAIASERGDVDALVHCAGGFRWSHFHEISDEDLAFLVNVNLLSTLWMVRGVLGPMRERGFGRIVVVSSRSTLAPGAGEGAYVASKAGLNALVQSIAAEIAPLDVTINAVLPSIIDTPANRADMPDADFDTWVPLLALADVIATFLSPIGAPINGALLPVSART